QLDGDSNWLANQRWQGEGLLLGGRRIIKEKDHLKIEQGGDVLRGREILHDQKVILQRGRFNLDQSVFLCCFHESANIPQWGDRQEPAAMLKTVQWWASD